ncbi:hypothetical protein [Streptomyces avermitilis]|uniref:hypothetical protein n=1 Tax=Streptomyces avermitilis TaxID=33903 RepID=UPI0033ACC0FB
MFEPNRIRTTASALTIDLDLDLGEVLAGRDIRDPAPRADYDLRRLAADRAVRGRREPRVVRNIPRRRGY